MKSFIGVAMIIIGTALGLYVGVWLCFIGGIVDVIQEVLAEHLSAMNVAIGIAKFCFAGLFGFLSAIVLILPGAGILGLHN